MNDPLIRIVGIKHTGVVNWLFNRLGEGGLETFLVPEPKNEHDPFAIAVVGEGQKIGYLPKYTTRLYPDLGDNTGPSWTIEFLKSGYPSKHDLFRRAPQYSIALKTCNEYEVFGELVDGGGTV